MPSEVDFSDVQTAPKSEVDFSDVPPATPLAKSQSYLDALNSGATPLPDTPEAHYAAAKEYFDGDALTQTAKSAGSGIGNFFKHPTVALGGIGTAIGNWADETDAQIQANAKAHPFLAPLMDVGSVAGGLVSGGINLANKADNFIDDTANYGSQLITRATGDADPGRLRAYADFAQRQTEAKKAAVDQAVTSKLGSPGLYSLGENAAPFLAPVPSLGLAGPIAKLGAGLGDAAESVILSPAGDALTSIASHSVGHGAGGFVKRAIIAPVVSAVAPKVGSLVEQATNAGLNTAAAGANNLAFSLAGAPAGSAEQNAEGAMANTALFSPVSITHGAFARQALNEATLAKQAAVRGMAEYGNNPDLDAATARGIAKLTPDQQRAVFEQRGLFQDIQNPEGKQIQIHVPDDYAARAQAANGGTVDDAANSRGFYLDGQGGVYLNPEAASTPGALQEALGHETGHSAYQDALPGVNERAATRLSNAVTNSALDANLQPTPDFQAFINQYATAAAGKPTAVDWNTLPVSGEGLTRNYLLNELGAETVRAATPDVGKQLAGPELSDHIANFTSDLATRLGLKAAPSATAILGSDGQPVPISTNALAAARTGSYAIGAQAADSFGSPVRIAEPNPVAKGQKGDTGQPISTSGQPPPQIEGTSNTQSGPVASPQPDTAFRNTQAYQDAFAIATLNKKFGGLGVKPSDARTLLDQAAQDPRVPNTNTDYVGYIQKARTAAAPAPSAPVLAPVTPVESAVAPNLAPVTNKLTLPLAQPLISPSAVALGDELPGAAPEVNPNAKRIYLLPGGPGGAKRIELPPVEPVNRFAGMDEPPQTGPTDTHTASMALESPESSVSPQTSDAAQNIRASDTVAGQDRPDIAVGSEDQSQSSSPEPTTANQSSASIQRYGPPVHEDGIPTYSVSFEDKDGRQVSGASVEGATPEDAVAFVERMGGTVQMVNNKWWNPFLRGGETAAAPKNQPAASPLTAADIARIETETEAAHTPNAYPKTEAGKRAKNQAADLAKAKADAVARAHADALPEGDDRVQARVDPDTGTVKLSGKRFVEGDAFHDRLLANASDAERANLSTIQDAIAQGKPLNFDYDSALRVRDDQTNAQRQQSQAISTAKDRAQGVGLAEEANHTFVPLSVSPAADGTSLTYGYAPDKVLGNAEKAIPLMRDNGLADRLPYTSVNDPQLTTDLQNYAQNHANGFKGDGSARLQPTEGVNVPAGSPDYTPHEIPPARANFINLIMGLEPTLSEKQVVKSTGMPTQSAVLRDFAAANDNVSSASGEVNPLRDALNSKGVLKVGSDAGSGAVMEPAFETIKPGLITRFHDTPGASEVPPLRAQSFQGDRGQIAPGGQVPSRNYAGAGFLPSIVRAGETIPGTTGRAAEDLPVQRFGNATVTGAGTQFLPAYHGTPHEVDRFDLSKIGTGEGAQVYGRGLYFAENRATADAYAYTLAGKGDPVQLAGRVWNELPKEASGKVSFYGKLWTRPALEKAFKSGLLDASLLPDDLRQKMGNVYGVDLDVHPDHLLDWDKPLSGQSAEVQEMLRSKFPGMGDHVSGERIYTHWAAARDGWGKSRSLQEDRKLASQGLQELGIPGIRYLDQGSRQSGGTHNYVMFDDSKIRITHKNDAPVEN